MRKAYATAARDATPSDKAATGRFRDTVGRPAIRLLPNHPTDKARAYAVARQFKLLLVTVYLPAR